MTTYEEISTCQKHNRRYWNHDCRYVITHIREAQRLNDNKRESHCRRWLATSLKHRAAHAYLERPIVGPDPSRYIITGDTHGSRQ